MTKPFTLRAQRLLARSLGALLVAGSLASCADAPAATTTAPTDAPTAAAGVESPSPTGGPRFVGGRLVAAARAMPTYSVDLSFENAGVVRELMVENGTVVKAGQVVARLDTAQADLSVADAEAGLRQARADYEKLLAKATPEQINRAQIQIAKARADMLTAQGEVSDQDLEAAKANLAAAKARLDLVLKGPKADAVTAAQADLDRAKADAVATQSRLAADKTNAESTIMLAANDLRTKQDFFSRIYWRNRGIESGGTLTQEQIDQEAAAKRDVDDAEELVGQRRVAYEELKQQEVAQIEAREADVRAAEANLRLVLNSVDAQDVASARANYADAQARLERLTGQRRQGLLDSAKADLDTAESNLALLVADPRTEDLALAEARVARAEVALKRSKLELDQLAIVAPHDGTIVGVDVSVGEVVEARKSVLALADLSSWRLQTEDLSELNVVSIREGDAVTINFFALPDLKLTGVVSRIDALGVNDRTVGVTYVATITPDSWDPRLRWNMTATVEIGATESGQ